MVVESHKHGGEILCCLLPEHMPRLIPSELSKTRLGMQPSPECISHEDVIHELRDILLIIHPSPYIVVGHVGSISICCIVEAGEAGAALDSSAGRAATLIRVHVLHFI